MKNAIIGLVIVYNPLIIDRVVLSIPIINQVAFCNLLIIHVVVLYNP